MNSEWFLFKGTHHIGPFTSIEIEVMYRAGDIARNVLVWKEGEPSWEPLFKVAHFKKLFAHEDRVEIELPVEGKSAGTSKVVVNLVDDLPPIPETVAVDEVTTLPKKLPPSLKGNVTETKKNPVLIEVDDDLPPPIPLDALTATTDKMVLPEKPRSPLSKKFIGLPEVDYSRGIMLVISLVVVGIFAWHFLAQNKNEVRFKIRNLMPMYIEKLENTAQDLSIDHKVALALSMDGGTVYMSTNSSKEMDVAIKLVPIPDRTLGKNSGTILLRGRAIDHLGTFNQVYNSNGETFAPGEYQYEVKISERHPINSYFPIFYKLGWTRNLNKKYSVTGKELIFSSSPRDFDFKIGRYLKEESEKILRPFLEQRERLSTIDSLLEQMLVLYSETVNGARSNKDSKLFENNYAKNIAPVLQSLIVSQDKDLNEINESVKEVSGLSLTMMNKLNALKKFKKSDKEKLIATIKNESDPIKNKITLKINRIEQQIKNVH